MVSIIVPVYQVEERIGGCIESILAQTDSDFELILIDDGSRDGSLKVCKEYAARDTRIRLFTQENAGVSVTRNRGMEYARGAYIQFVDSDDCIAPHMVQTLVQAIEETKADMVVCGILKRFPDHDEQIQPLHSGKFRVRELQQTYPEIFGNYILYSPVNKLYRREKIRDRFLPGLSFGEDYTFNLAYLRSADSVVFVQENLYFYLIAPNSLTQRYSPDRIRTAQQLYRQGLDFCRKVGLRQPAVADLSGNYLETLFYAISDLYQFEEMSGGEKRRILRQIAGTEDVKVALEQAHMPRFKQRVQQFMLRRNLIGLYHMQLTALKMLRGS